jgi:hypothetical protein
LLHLLDAIDVAELKGLLSNRKVVFHLDNLGIFLENDAKVVLNGCESFVGHLYTAVRKKVNFVFLDFSIEMLSCVVEESALYLGAVHVNKTDFEKRTALVGCPFLGFTCNTRLDLPISCKSV